LMKAVGIALESGPPAPTPPSAGLDLAALSALIGADLSHPYVVLHPSPRWRYKQWSDDGWRSLIQCLLGRAFTVVVTGGPGDDERRYLEGVLGDLSSPGLIPLPGRLSLAQTADLIRHARLFVGVDTATTHLAAATGTPTVAIFGPTDPLIWGPWGGAPYERVAPLQQRGNVTLIQNPALPCVPCQQEGCERHPTSRSDCLDRLAPARVIAEVEQVLRGERRPSRP
jgi:heptosyltransferase III